MKEKALLIELQKGELETIKNGLEESLESKISQADLLKKENEQIKDALGLAEINSLNKDRELVGLKNKIDSLE